MTVPCKSAIFKKRHLFCRISKETKEDACTGSRERNLPTAKKIRHLEDEVKGIYQN